jgi:glycerophosphoryl diester phosphodiesterase
MTESGGTWAFAGSALYGAAMVALLAGCWEGTGPDMLIIGHRGAAGHAPEHTFASWDLALEMGVDYLEQDLQMTADGQLIVMHDDTLDRTARGPNCNGPVITRTLAELTGCDAGSWFNDARPDRARPEFVGQRIPTLDSVLARYGGRARFYIETKNPEIAPGMEEALVTLLDQHGLLPWKDEDEIDRVFVQSFSTASLLRVRSLNEFLPLVHLFARAETPTAILARLDSLAEFAQGIGPHYSDVDAGLVAAAHERGLVVHPYTVNAPAEMRRLNDIDVDGMFTDYPDVLAAILRR